MLRRVLFAVAATFIVVAVILAVSGGFRTTVGGFRISARSPLAASAAALIAGGAWLALARRDRAIAPDLEATWRAMERHASRLIGVVALTAASVAATFATRSAAGADASGYLSQAALWADGAWLVTNPLADVLGGSDTSLLTPLGWRPAGSSYQVPTYPPGLPLLMAIPHAIAGLDGANAVVIASAAIAVWATGMVTGGVGGIIAAILIAFSPVFLYQSFQPMSDVPVTAAWMLCFLILTIDKPFAYARSATADKKGLSPHVMPPHVMALLGGIACAIAVLIRPNLAPLAMVPFFVAKKRFTFTLPVMMAGAFIAFLQWLWYGSPVQSGYGSTGELFSMSNVTPNAGHYFNWLLATAPVLFLAPFGLIRLRHNAHARAMAAFAALVAFAYFVYAVFDHWSYLRFLLPAMAVMAIFAAIVLAGWIDRLPSGARFPIFLGLTLGVVAHSLFAARTLDTFKLADQLRRVEQAAAFIDRTAPPDAVLLAGEQSGSMRYYTGRPILRWEAATPGNLTKALAALEETTRPIYVVLDAWENEPFLAKFKDVSAVALDWPPLLDAGASHRTKVWRLSDRARFLNGEHLSTVRLP